MTTNRPLRQLGAASGLIVSVASRAAGLITVVLLARTLDVEGDLGSYLALTTTAFLGANLIVFGADRRIGRMIASNGIHRDALALSGAVRLLLIGFTLGLPSVWFIVNRLASGPALVLVAATLALAACDAVLRVMADYFRASGGVTMANIVSPAGRLVLNGGAIAVLVAASTDVTVELALASGVFAGILLILGGLLGAYRARPILASNGNRLPTVKAPLRESVRSGASITLNSLSVAVINAGDVVVAGVSLSGGGLDAYAVAVRVMGVIAIVPTVLGSISGPEFARSGSLDAARELRISIGRKSVLSTATMTCTIAAMADTVVAPLFEVESTAFLSVFLILATGQGFALIHGPVGLQMIYSGNETRASLVAAILLPLVLFCQLSLASFHGHVGLAVASAGASAALPLSYLASMRRRPMSDRSSA